MSFKSMIVIALGLLFLYGLFTVGLPFLLALVLVLLIEPINQFFIDRLKMKRIVAATITSTLLVLLFLGLVLLIAINLFAQFSVLLQHAPAQVRNIASYLQTVLAEQTERWAIELGIENEQQLSHAVESGADALSNALINFVNFLSRWFFDLASHIPNLFVFFIVFAVAVYLISYSLPNLKTGFLSMFEERFQPKVDVVLQNLHRSVFGFIRAQLIFSSITYVLSALGLILLRVDYALVIALGIVIVDILPILGVGSFLVPWAIYELVTGDVYLAVGLFVLFIIITVVRRIIEPKILGDQIGIGPLPTLISLYVGLKLAGVVGLFLGPILVIIYKAMRKEGLLNFKFKLE